MNNEPTIIEAFDTELLLANENYIQLKEIAKKTTNFIYQQMHNLTKKLEDAKRLSSDAECADDDGWFNRKFGNGETAIEKRSKLNTKVNILHKMKPLPRLQILCKQAFNLPKIAQGLIEQ